MPINEVHTRKILECQNVAIQAGALNIWTVYDHPTDFPDNYVVRRAETLTAPEPILTGDILLFTDLEVLRETMLTCGLVCLTRNDGDDPVILETWL